MSSFDLVKFYFGPCETQVRIGIDSVKGCLSKSDIHQKQDDEVHISPYIFYIQPV